MADPTTPYTPSERQIRDAWLNYFEHTREDILEAEFDRFIAQVRAEALEEAAQVASERDSTIAARIRALKGETNG